MNRQILFATLLLLFASFANAQDPDQIRMYNFKKNKDFKIPVINAEAFAARYGNNPDVPKNGRELRSLSARIYKQREPLLFDDGCGEHAAGLLFAAMQNPQLSEADLDAVDADADVPDLPLTYTSGHFKFFYTTSSANANDNVTLAQVQATATVLNNAWNDYAVNFKEPKHYVSGGVKLIDVRVYDLGPGLLGQTGSSWNHIDLDSKRVVADACKRQTTPVHELFHRVQYAYTYISGTANMKWAVEATASWSQKYRAPAIGDWKQRMDSGLGSPDLDLITTRSYNACHLWVYLGQRAGNERTAIKKAWSTYQTNGKNMRAAVNTTVNDLLPAAYFAAPKFESLIMSWTGANILKDATSIPALWDYAEDETSPACGGVTYGPLASVPKISANVVKGGNYTGSGTVADLGADYYVFTLGSTVTSTKLEITGAATSKLTYFQAELVNNQMINVNRGPLSGAASRTLTRPALAMAGTRQIVVAVIGMGGGGNYNVKLSGL